MRNSLGLSWDRAVVFVLPLLLSAGYKTFGGDITCLRDKPAPYLLISTLPTPPPDASIGCDPVPLPDACFPSAVPTVAHWPERLPQELMITATPLDPIGTYYSAHVWAQYLDSATSTWKDLWVHESKDAVDAAIAAGHPYIEFNATGLKPGTAHRFRVGWCRRPTSVKGCNCYPEAAGFVDESAPFGEPDPQPTLFPSPPIAAPTPIELQDDFRGPPTTPKRSRGDNSLNLGDGLGPKEVWMTDDASANPLAPSMNGSRIASSSGVTYAEIPTNAQILNAKPLTQQHSFAEIQGRGLSTTFRQNPPTGGTCPAPGSVPSGRNYRLIAQTRTIEDAGIPYGYGTQAIYEPDWGCDGTAQGEPVVPNPTIRIVRLVGVSSPAILATKDVKTTPAYTPALGEGCEKDGMGVSPGLTGIAGLTNGSEVLIRIEVQNGGGHPQLTSWLGWNCSSGQCQWRCRWNLNDLTIDSEHPLYKNFDSQLQGFRSNHWDDAIGTIRAGSKP